MSAEALCEDSVDGLAKAVGVSRSTASRFFSGRPKSLAVTLTVLAELGLTFQQVATPEDGQGESEGGAGGGAPRRPAPVRPQPSQSPRLDGGLPQ